MTDDLISRQAAIDAMDEIDSEVADGYGFQYEKWRQYFCELPSAQPEIIRCKDCKHWDIHKRLNIPWCRYMHIDRGAEDFCSNAERRTDG